MWQSALDDPPWVRSKWAVVTPNPMRSEPPRFGKGSDGRWRPARDASCANATGAIVASEARAAAPVNTPRRRTAEPRNAACAPPVTDGLSRYSMPFPSPQGYQVQLALDSPPEYSVVIPKRCLPAPATRASLSARYWSGKYPHVQARHREITGNGVAVCHGFGVHLA